MPGRKTRTRKTYKKKPKDVIRTKKDVVKVLKSFAEHKYYENEGSYVIRDGHLGTIYPVVNVQNIPQGDTAQTREGDVIQPVYLRLKIGIRSTSSANTFVRLLVLRYDEKLTSLSGTAVGAFLINPVTTGFNSIDPIVMEPSSRKRFSIIKDQVYHISSVTKDGVFIDMRYRCPRTKTIDYDETATNSGSGMYLVYLIADDDSVCTAYWTSELKYVDV